MNPARTVLYITLGLINHAVCHAAGHDWSWALAAQTGHKQPVCRRCLVASENVGRG